MGSTLKPNHAAFAEMAVGPEIRIAVKAIAEEAKGIAEALAAGFVDTGEYAASFEVSDRTIELPTKGYGSHPVAAGILENTSGHAAAVEWGNGDDPQPHRTLVRTLGLLNHV